MEGGSGLASRSVFSVTLWQKTDQKPTDADRKMKSPVDLGCEGTVDL
jgi:hypothetical protein